MSGKIIQINISAGGVPKKPVPTAFVSFERVEGDDWRFKDVHGGPQQAILMISKENIDLLIQSGFPLFAGALGENFTTEGLDYKEIRYGERFRAGDSLEFRITKRRAPCKTVTIYGNEIAKALFDREAAEHNPGSAHWGMSGFYGEVLKTGTIKTGDEIIRI